MSRLSRRRSPRRPSSTPTATSRAGSTTRPAPSRPPGPSPGWSSSSARSTPARRPSADRNKFIRCVTVKEQHAELVKHEVQVIWSDYFKPEHLEANPDLHTKVWNILKLAGKNKQIDRRRGGRPARGRGQGVRRHLLVDQEVAAGPGPSVAGDPRRRTAALDVARRLPGGRSATSPGAPAGRGGSSSPRIRCARRSSPATGCSSIRRSGVWPRRGTIVVVREPGSDLLAIKRVAARPGDVIRTTDGPIRLSPTQAWLLGDDRAVSLDSRALRPGRARPARRPGLVPLRPARAGGRARADGCRLSLADPTTRSGPERLGTFSTPRPLGYRRAAGAPDPRPTGHGSGSTDRNGDARPPGPVAHGSCCSRRSSERSRSAAGHPPRAGLPLRRDGRARARHLDPDPEPEPVADAHDRADSDAHRPSRPTRSSARPAGSSFPTSRTRSPCRRAGSGSGSTRSRSATSPACSPPTRTSVGSCRATSSRSPRSG